MIIKIVFFILFATSSFSLALSNDSLPLQEEENLSPMRCKKSKAPLFKDNSVVEIEVMTNLQEYFYLRKEENKKNTAPGIVSIKSDSSKENFLPVVFQTRGRSRHNACEYRPIRLKFLDSEIESEIENSIGSLSSQEKELQGSSTQANNDIAKKSAYFRKYMEAYKSFYSEDLENVPQNNNIFDKIGDDVKIVTHCGSSSWGNSLWAGISGTTEDKQENRLFGEFLYYQILSELKTVTMKVRLAKITYRYLNGYPMTTKWAMFRENVASVAKRCHLEKTPSGALAGEATSFIQEFHGNFIHKFVDSFDFNIKAGHNAKVLYKVDQFGSKKVYLPYDFDLSRILLVHHKQPIDKFAWNFKRFIKSFASHSQTHRTVALIQIRKVLKQRDDIRELIEKSRVTGRTRKNFLKWYRSYFSALNSLKKELEN